MSVPVGTGTTKEWIQFFTESGIPAGIAASYALTFSNNRIRMDMLLDLNKEYLKDMGITLMGDVISILRHAKHVHEQNAREKILASSTSAGSSTAGQKSTPASRMIDHYIRKTDTSTYEENEESSQHTLALEKRKIELTNLSMVRAKKQKVKAPENVAVPSSAKKVCVTVPEEIRSYKIKVPSVSAPRTPTPATVVRKQTASAEKKKTVFDRLGDSSVTSTTGEDEKPSITITGLGSNIVKPISTAHDKQSSVFLRLGEKSQMPSTSYQDVEEVAPVLSEAILPYAGVFKQGATKKVMKSVDVKYRLPTMQADIESAKKLKTKDGFIVSKPVQVQGRLGPSVTEESNPGEFHNLNITRNIIKPNKTTAGILGNPTNARKLNVKARLGDSVGTSTSHVDLDSTEKVSFLKRTTYNYNKTLPRNREVTTNVTTPKMVRFGGVTKKQFIPEEAINAGERKQRNYTSRSSI